MNLRHSIMNLRVTKSPARHETRMALLFRRVLLAFLPLLLLLAAAPGARAQEAPPNFGFDIIVTDGDVQDTLTAGLDVDATDTYDPELDTFYPPPPPAGAFDDRIKGNDDDYKIDFRESEFGVEEFEVAYRPSEDNGPIVLSWDSSQLPDNVQGVMVDAATGEEFNLDVREQSSLDVSTNPFINQRLILRFNVVAPPEAPSDLGAAATSSTEIDLSWTDNADDEDNFEVERSVDGGDTFSLLSTKEADAESHADSGLAPNNEYCYRVRAGNDAGFSEYSSVVCATTLKAQLGFAPDVLSFSLQAGNAQQQSATLTASVAPEGPVSLSKDAEAEWLTVPGTAQAGSDVTLTADASGLSAGEYTATVTASDPDYNDGVLNVTLVVSEIEAPSDLSAIVTSSTVIDLSWTDNADNEDNFEVERSVDGGDTFSLLATKEADAESHTDSGLSPGTEYCYRVRATNADGSSGPSNTACATTEEAVLSFGAESLPFSLVEGANTDQASVTVSTSPVPDDPSLSLSKGEDADWLTVPSTAAIGEAFDLTADASSLSQGTYTTTVTASANAAGYTDATLEVTLTVTPDVEIDFSVPVDVSDENGNGIVLALGTGPDATDGYDPGYDAFIPPPPPSTAFDARFTQDGQDDLRNDYRATNIGTITWAIDYDASSDGDPITLDWSGADFPEEGRFNLVDPVNGEVVSVDMREQSSFTVPDSYGLNRLEVVYSLTSLFDMSVDEGWDLVGLPLDALDKDYQAVFSDVEPTQIPFARNDGSYVRESVLQTDKGYWVQFLSAGTQTVEGYEIESTTLELDENWNLVNGPSCNVPLSGVEDPDGILETVYTYNNGYLPVETFAQGRGHWVKAATAGTITLDCATTSGPMVAATPAAASRSASGSEKSRLVLRDAAGSEQTLFLNDAEVENASVYAMPPLPPQGAFDVRFEGDTRLLSADEGRIELRGVQFPLRVQLSGALPDDGHYVLEALSRSGQVLATHPLGGGTGSGGADGESASQQQKRRVTLSAGAEALRVRRATEALPGSFALQGNYPNPVRTLTNVALNLPERAEVTVAVYDALGRRVRQVKRSLAAGQQQKVRLEARGLSSGTYFYRVTAKMESGVTETATGHLVMVR